MSIPRLGVILDDDTQFVARASDPVAVVALRSTLLNPPRSKAATQIGERLCKAHPSSTLAIYAWHYVTHAPADGMSERATRSLGSAAAPASWGHLQASPVVDEAWTTTANCVAQVGASTVVLGLPPSFTPSSLNRARLRAFAATHGGGPQSLVWDVRGLWGASDAVSTAEKIGVTAMLPATEASQGWTAGTEALWIRVEHGRREADQLFDELLAADVDAATLTVLFSGSRAFADLRHFHGRCTTEL